MRHFVVLAAMCSCSGASAVAKEPAQRTEYTTVAALRTLDCVESWEQLCSPPIGADGRYLGPDVSVLEDRVEVSPFAGPEKFVFRVVGRSESTFQLELAACAGVERCAGRGQLARLRTREDGSAVFEGPNVYRLLEGQIETVHVELVRTSIYNQRHDALEKEYVPGGACQGLAGYQPTGHGKCLNAPGHLRK